MSLQSPLGRVLGKGSAKSGLHHWWVQRVTAVALVPLSLWFVFSLATLGDLSHASVTAFIGQPFHAVLVALLAAVLLHHSYLGLQVVVEDYVHHKGVKIVTMLLLNFLHVLVGASAVFAVLRISLTAVSGAA